MYQVKLKESYFAAMPGEPLLSHSIGETLRLASIDSTDKKALVEVCVDGSMGREWTYGELYEQSERLAYSLSSKYEKGTRIAVCAYNIPEWVILEYAAALAGLIVVTVNPSFQASEVSYVIGQSGAVALFLVKSYRGNPISDIAVQVQAEQPGLRDIIDMQEADQFWAEPTEMPSQLPKVDDTDSAQIQYTSGTTGFPKGALLHHRGLLNNGFLAGQRLNMDKETIYLNMMPLFHTAGCGLGNLSVLAVRAQMILVAQFDPEVVNNVIEKEQVSVFLAVPTMLVAMLEELSKQPRSHSSVKSIMSGGAIVAPSLVQQGMEQWGCAVQVVYGQTETSPMITQTWHTDTPEDLSGTVGQPLPHTEVAVLDPSSGEILPLDQVGEICTRGYLVMHGYYENPEATNSAIDKDNWLHTGDLGTIDARGYISVTGRVKEMIIRGGENIYPAQIENCMITHPLVEEAAVVGIPDPKWGEIVCCFVRVEDINTKITKTELVEHARSVLSAQKTPAHWVVVNEWPLTESGKIQKFKLREQFEEGLYETI